MNKLQIVEMLQQHHPHLGMRECELFIEFSANKIAIDTDVHKRTDLTSSVAGKRYYAINPRTLRIDKVWFNDVLIPRLVGDILIDDDEYLQNTIDAADTPLPTPTSQPSNDRYWYVNSYAQIAEGSDADHENAERRTHYLAIVERVTNAVTRDGRTSDYQSCSVTGTTNLRWAGSFIPETFAEDNDSASTDATTSNLGPMSAIPVQYHDVMLDGAIARGYSDPRSFNPNIAQYFEQKFEKGIKRIKKYERAKQLTGFVRPQAY